MIDAQMAALIAELKALVAEARARADERRPDDLPPTYLYGLGMGYEKAQHDHVVGMVERILALSSAPR